MHVTRIGGPTFLVELDSWRILIDPTFDPPGSSYSFGLGTSSTKTLGPAVSAEQVQPIDVILLSHDHHADNLDRAGRALLPRAEHVITTRSGAKRLRLPNVRSMKAGRSTRLVARGKQPLQVTATPARHGPAFSRPIVGSVTGFLLRLGTSSRYDLWVTGDTVLTRRLKRLARSLYVDTAILNGGGVRFDSTGPVEYTMTGADVVELASLLRPRVAIPAHYDGWSHFHDGATGMRRAIRDAAAPTRRRFLWLPDGLPVDIAEHLRPPLNPPERTPS